MSEQVLSVRYNVKYQEWLVYDSHAERIMSKGHATELSAIAAMTNLISRGKTV